MISRERPVNETCKPVLKLGLRVMASQNFDFACCSTVQWFSSTFNPKLFFCFVETHHYIDIIFIAIKLQLVPTVTVLTIEYLLLRFAEQPSPRLELLPRRYSDFFIILLKKRFTGINLIYSHKAVFRIVIVIGSQVAYLDQDPTYVYIRKPLEKKDLRNLSGLFWFIISNFP